MKHWAIKELDYLILMETSNNEESELAASLKEIRSAFNDDGTLNSSTPMPGRSE